MAMIEAERYYTSTAVIAGGGPAGASLAIRLVEAGYSVTLIERERFPRHKLCGEFISPECLAHFADLGVLDEILGAGGERIKETKFFDEKGRNFSVPSSLLGNAGPALSLSRARMDEILLNRARAVGANVIEGARMLEMSIHGGLISAVRLTDGREGRSTAAASLFVDATGRARALTRLTDKALGTAGSGKARPTAVAFKNHFAGISLEPSVCEIYAFPGGYGGLTSVEGGLSNLCFLLDAETARTFGPQPEDLLANVLHRNERLRKTAANARPLMDWYAVSIDKFGRAPDLQISNLFAVGDAGAFIDPFTGSGMLMAFEGSAMLAASITAFDGDPGKVRRKYLRACDRGFSRRLFISSLLRKAARSRYFPAAAVAVLRSSSRFRGIVAASTRAGRMKDHGFLA